jgi:hypothetical protein
LETLIPYSYGTGDFLKEPKVYEDLTDLTVLKTAMETALNEYNLSPSVVPMQLVLFREAIEHSKQLLLLVPPPSSQSPVSLPRSFPNQVPELSSFTVLYALVAMGV